MKLSDDIKTFGEAVRSQRERLQLTLRALAEKLDVSAPFLSDVEHNRRLPKDVSAIEEALQLDAGELQRLDTRSLKRSEIEEVKARVAKLEHAVFGAVVRFQKED